MEVSENQRRDSFDQLGAMYREICTVSDILKIADEHRAKAKRHLESAGLAVGLSLMIPGKPLVFFFGGTWDGWQTNLEERLIKAGSYSTPLRESGRFIPHVVGETGFTEEPSAIETYEPAIAMMHRNSVISAIMVRAGFARSFKKRACSTSFNSEIAALLKLIAISLGTSDIRYISATLAHYRKTADAKPDGECCIIQIEK